MSWTRDAAYDREMELLEEELGNTDDPEEQKKIRAAIRELVREERERIVDERDWSWQ